MRRYIRLVGILFKFKLSRSMIYSGNFWMAFIVDFFLFVFQLVAFVSIYQFIDTINGWDLNQMFVFIGTFSIVDSMAMGTFFFGIINLPEKIRTGSLDIMIAKPIDTQFFVSAESFNPGSLFGIITGSCMVMYGLSSGGYVVSMIQVLGYILLLIMMYLLFYSMMLIVRTLAFIFVKINTLTQVEDSVIEFAFRIPGTAFKGISKVIFMVIIPYGLIATVPTEHITNMLEPSQWLIVTGITLFFFGLARFMFKFGMGRYTSASS